MRTKRITHNTPGLQLGGNSAEEFKAAWIYVHNYFRKNGAENVIWVWNPWKPAAVQSYFPGKQYVDWIGVTNLNYAAKNGDKTSYSMQQLYQPFHEHPVFKMGLPVMLAEMGSLAVENKQEGWLQNAFQDIKTKFPEIRAFVLFNSGLDKNNPAADGVLDWRVEDLNKAGQAIKQTDKQLSWLSTGRLIVSDPSENQGNRSNTQFLQRIRGVNYAKGQSWSTNGHALKKKEIIADISAMKKIGINTIKYYGLNFYEQNVLEVARDNNINITYSFWMPDHPNFFSDKKALDDYSAEILQAITDNKDDQNIVMWNIGNTPLNDINYNYSKPDLFYIREAYVSWLKDLIHHIKEADPGRPVSVDLDTDDQLHENVRLLQSRIPEIDCYGLVTTKDAFVKTGDLNVPYFYSRIRANDYLDAVEPQTGAFIANWQDEKAKMYVTLDGLKAAGGLNKFEYYRLANRWNGQQLPAQLPQLKILLPATTILANSLVTFHAAIFNHNQWSFIDDPNQLKLKWELVKHDKYGNPLEVKALGEGTQVTFTVPENPARYKLNLYAIKGSLVKIVQSKLNIPLK